MLQPDVGRPRAGPGSSARVPDDASGCLDAGFGSGRHPVSAQPSRPLPHLSDKIFLADAGLETELVFLDGIDLPRFAAVDPLRTDGGPDRLGRYDASSSHLPGRPTPGSFPRPRPGARARTGDPNQAAAGRRSSTSNARRSDRCGRSAIGTAAKTGWSADASDPGARACVPTRSTAADEAQANFADVLGPGSDRTGPIAAIRADAPCEGHAETESSTERDDRARRLAGRVRPLPHIRVLGRCKGTDRRPIPGIAYTP